jgi:hypothetical protein
MSTPNLEVGFSIHSSWAEARKVKGLQLEALGTTEYSKFKSENSDAAYAQVKSIFIHEILPLSAHLIH